MGIALIIVAWILCAGITCGVMMHVQPDEWGDAPVLCMGLCLVGWFLFALMGIGYIVLKQLSKVGLFFAGFLDKEFERKEDEDA